MKTKLLFLSTVLFIVGCAPTGLVDKLPKETPKGYVEFYYLKSEGDTDYCPDVYSIYGDKGAYEGRLYSFSAKDKVFLRLAKIPGKYTFFVRLIGNEYQFPIQIREGMITVIKITFTDVHSSRRMQGNKIVGFDRFKWEAVLEKNVPVAEYDSEWKR
jgi:hypothetical protein